MEGTFTKIISYEGGITVVGTWGNNPFSHEDDAARAVFAAISIKKAIKKFAFHSVDHDFNAPVHIGICTGNVFTGIVGN